MKIHTYQAALANANKRPVFHAARRSAPRFAAAHALRVDEASGVGSVAEERAGHDAALASFLAMDRDAPWRPHPAFGAMTGTSWGVMLHKHADHHLSQFGA